MSRSCKWAADILSPYVGRITTAHIRDTRDFYTRVSRCQARGAFWRVSNREENWPSSPKLGSKAPFGESITENVATSYGSTYGFSCLVMASASWNLWINLTGQGGFCCNTGVAHTDGAGALVAKGHLWWGLLLLPVDTHKRSDAW